MLLFSGEGNVGFGMRAAGIVRATAAIQTGGQYGALHEAGGGHMLGGLTVHRNRARYPMQPAAGGSGLGGGVLVARSHLPELSRYPAAARIPNLIDREGTGWI